MKEEFGVIIAERLDHSINTLMAHQDRIDKILDIVEQHIEEKLPNCDLSVEKEIEYVNTLVAQYTESMLLLVKVRELINAEKEKKC